MDISSSNTNTENLDLKINLLDGPNDDDVGKLMIVSGFFHEFTFNSEEANVSLERGENSYHWYYEKGWKGDTQYMNTDSSLLQDGKVCLVAGIEADEPEGSWNLTINGDNYEVIVEQPDKGISFSSADFNIYAEPFTAQNISSAPQKYRLINEGNSPISYQTNFRSYANCIKASHQQGILSPGESIESYISITTEKWEPEIKSIEGKVEIAPINVVSNATFSLMPKWEFDLDINITIGSKGYDFREEDGITIQYPRTRKMKLGQTKEITIFFSGDEDFTFDVSGEVIDIKSIKDKKNIDVPERISLGSKKLYPINITIKATGKDSDTKINYKISQGNSSNIYSTDIMLEGEVDDLEEKEDTKHNQGQDGVLNLIILGSCLSLPIIYLSIKNYKGKKDD